MAGEERGAAKDGPSKAGEGQPSMRLVPFRRLSGASCPSATPHARTHFRMKKQRQDATEVTR